MKKTIGIPRALLYYKYFPLWKSFFESLNFEVIVSQKTTSQIIEVGSQYTIDEACLSLKIFMGHIASLIGKCDYILVPRIVSLKKKEELCTNFSALYDMACNAFPKANIIYYNIDEDLNQKEQTGFIKMGKSIKRNEAECFQAYHNAKQRYKEHRIEKYKEQLKNIGSNKVKILLAGHPYNLYDNMIGYPIASYLERLGVQIIWSDIYDKSTINREYRAISNSVYWTYSKEMLGAIIHYKEKVDGILIISTFPCGTDSLTNEMCIRKIHDIPIATIIVDEQNSGTGLYTRLESFVDIIERRKLYEKSND